jgi:hypothetical protein
MGWKTYEVPTVEDLGTLAELTQGGAANVPDPVTMGVLAGGS